MSFIKRSINFILVAVIMKRFFPYIKKHKKYYFLSLLMLLLGVGFDAAMPWFVQKLVDDVLIGQNTSHMWAFLLAMLGCYIFKGLTKYAQEYTSDIVGSLIIRDCRNDLFNHIEKQDQGFFKENTPGELMSRVKHDTEMVGFSLGFIGLFLLQLVVQVVVMLVCLIKLSLPVAIVCVCIMPIIAVIAFKEEKKGDKIFDDISEETATMNQTASEAITAIRTVKAFNREEHEKKRFEKRNKHFFNLSVNLEKVFSGYDGIITLIGRIMQALAILVGGLMVLRNSMTLGELASSTSYVNNLMWPMMELGWIINEISGAVASGRKINKIFNTSSSIKEGTQAIRSKGELEFRGVSASFGTSKVLDDVSFTLKSGGTLGIMGATGSGKTTITNMALRFLDPQSGQILLDGEDIRNLDFDSLRGAFAIVTQDIFLFSETVMENLKIGSSQMEDKTAINAALMARADGFITKLEEGYKTVIGEKGVGLSGGQKQRLCIARALAKRAPILVLDDATSALDMETEREIQHELRDIENRQSTIIVAHRISAVRRADEIIYLDSGRIVERGTHEQLMALKGRYYETYVAQYSKEEADGCK